MADEEYERRMVYAGEPEQPVEQLQQPPGQKEEKKERRMADWLLVVVAAVGLLLTIYYIGFGHIKAPENLWPNETGTNQNQTGNQSQPEPNITWGSLGSVAYTGNTTTLLSRQDFNLTLLASCSGLCKSLYMTANDGSTQLAYYEFNSSWNGTRNVTMPVMVPKRVNASCSITVVADSRSADYSEYGSLSEVTQTVQFFVLDAPQHVVYGKEFYLEVGEKGNLSDLNVSIGLDWINSNTAHVSVLRSDGVMFSSDLAPVNKPNATFFDFLTIEIMELGSSQVKLVAWPNGFPEAVAIEWPPAGNISAAQTFRIYIKCTGTCAATYVGLHALHATNLTRIGYYNSTKAWSGWQTVNITTSIPYWYVNRTFEVKVLVDTRNSRNAYFVDLWHPAETTISSYYSVY